MSQVQSTAAAPNFDGVVVSNAGSIKAKHSLKTSRMKTEPANGYLQFMQAKKKAEIALDPNFKLNLGKVQTEWKELSEAQQAVYKEMAQMEKIELGNNFRKDRSRKIKEIVASKPCKKQRPQRNKRTKPQKQEKFIVGSASDKSLANLMKRYKDMDTEIKTLDANVENLRSDKQSKSVELAVNKARLQIKSENVILLKEKMSNMLRLHTSCSYGK